MFLHFKKKSLFDTLLSVPHCQIIKFGIIGAHELPYIVIKKGIRRKYRVIEKYDIISLLKEVNFVFGNLSEGDKIALLRRILDVSEAHLKMNGWDVLE